MSNIKLQTVRAFAGFGAGEKVGAGEYFYSLGMSRTFRGISPRWKTTEKTNSGSLSGLLLTKFFAQPPSGSASSYVFTTQSDGKIFKSQYGHSAFALAHTTAQDSSGNGLIGSQAGELLYMQDRYMGLYNGATWNDTYKDFGADYTGYRPAATYEDWVVIGNGNKVAIYNVTDNSFNAAGLTFPSSFTVHTIAAGARGILIGARLGTRSVLILWDAQSERSIAPWIWIKEKIESVQSYEDKFIVITEQRIYITDGYGIVEFAPLPNPKLSSTFMDVEPQGCDIIRNKLIIANSRDLKTRTSCGFWILDLDTQLWEFQPVASGATAGVTLGAVWTDDNARIQAAWTIGSVHYLGYIENAPPSRASYISPPVAEGTSNWKVAEAIKLNLGLDIYSISNQEITMNIEVRIYDFRRKFFNRGTTNGTSQVISGGYIVHVDGSSSSINKAEIGDEVIILDGAYAGESAHITEITNAGLSNEYWTLDRELTGLLANSTEMMVTPFKKVARLEISNASQLNELYFDCKNRRKGRKFLVKILFEGLTGVTPELQSFDLIFDDLGIN